MTLSIMGIGLAMARGVHPIGLRALRYGGLLRPFGGHSLQGVIRFPSTH